MGLDQATLGLDKATKVYLDLAYKFCVEASRFIFQIINVRLGAVAFDARSLSNMAWSLATLDPATCSGDASLFPEISRLSLVLLQQFNAQACSIVEVLIYFWLHGPVAEMFFSRSLCRHILKQHH